MANTPRLKVLGVASLLMTLMGCGEDAENVGSTRTPLVAVCAESVDEVPPGAWLCGARRRVECDAQPGTAAPDAIYVVPGGGCQGRRLVVEAGPFALGEREIVVREELAGDAPDAKDTREVCRSALIVVDTTPPTIKPARLQLWPPNHALHSLSARQCARAFDACDPYPEARFTSATSDEPVDALGDGSHEPDIVFDHGSLVSLRAERQGTGNGRVYTLGFETTDASGNATRGSCSVTVPHDSSGRAALADANAYVVPAP